VRAADGRPVADDNLPPQTSAARSGSTAAAFPGTAPPVADGSHQHATPAVFACERRQPPKRLLADRSAASRTARRWESGLRHCAPNSVPRGRDGTEVQAQICRNGVLALALQTTSDDLHAHIQRNCFRHVIQPYSPRDVSRNVRLSQFVAEARISRTPQHPVLTMNGHSRDITMWRTSVF
jgi:hypothetical protein